MEFIMQPLAENIRQANTVLDPLGQHNHRIDSDVQNFYNALVLWTCICPTMSDKPMELSTIDMTERMCNWRNFLNSLCTLVDYNKGGETVPAIGVQDAISSVHYWVASNHSSNNTRIVDHLEWIMAQLQHLLVSPVARPEDVENQILEKSLHMGRKKAENYRQQLRKYVESALQTNTPKEWHDTSLYTALEALKESPWEHSKVCKLVHDFRHSEERKLLDSFSNSDPTLRSVRHYVGRLGSWRKAAHTVVVLATEFKKPILQAKISAVPEFPHQQLPIVDLDVADAIHHILPSDSLSDSSLVALDRLTHGDLRDKFPTRLRTVIDEARMHSEVIIAEYFYSQKLRFFFQYAYIGCSKPSCYSCDKYLRHHPGRFVSRSCHGNVWLKWLVPTSSPSNLERISPYNRETINKMTESICTDIQEQLLLKRERNGKGPDSTTGLTSSRAPSINKL